MKFYADGVSEVVFGWVDDNKYEYKKEFAIQGMTKHWQFNGLNEIECGTYILPSSGELVRFSTSSPYIFVPIGKVLCTNIPL